jgi:hypothetical protein
LLLFESLPDEAFGLAEPGFAAIASSFLCFPLWYLRDYRKHVGIKRDSVMHDIRMLTRIPARSTAGQAR